MPLYLHLQSLARETPNPSTNMLPQTPTTNRNGSPSAEQCTGHLSQIKFGRGLVSFKLIHCCVLLSYRHSRLISKSRIPLCGYHGFPPIPLALVLASCTSHVLPRLSTPYRDRAPSAPIQSHNPFGLLAVQRPCPSCAHPVSHLFRHLCAPSTFNVLPRRQPAISTKGAPRDFYTSTQDKGCDHRAFYVPERSFLQVLLHHDHSERVCCNRHYIAPISKRVRTRFAHHAPRRTFRVEIFCCTFKSIIYTIVYVSGRSDYLLYYLHS